MTADAPASFSISALVSLVNAPATWLPQSCSPMAMGPAVVRKARPISVAGGQIKTPANGGAAVNEAKIRSITFSKNLSFVT